MAQNDNGSGKAKQGKGWDASIPQCPACKLWLHGVQGQVCDRKDCPTDLDQYGMKKAD